MSFFTWKGSNRSENIEHGGHNLQDGLFQIASQACHILVQVNNTHNVSYGGNNNVRNIAYSKCSDNGKDPIRHTASSTSKAPTSASKATTFTSRATTSTSRATTSTSKATTSTVKSYAKYMKEQGKDQDVVVLLPHHKSRTPLVKHKLSPVAENEGLELNPSKYNGSGGRNGGSGASAANGNTTAPDDDFELWDYSGLMLRNDTDNPITKWKGVQRWFRPSCIPITIILIMIVLVVLLPLLDHAADKHDKSNDMNFDFDASCMNGCNLSFVETLPIGMNYTNNTVFLDNTYDSWVKLISLAREKIEIASFYWTMRREDVYPDDSAKKGEEVFHLLLQAGRERNILLKITQNIPSQTKPNIDTEVLTKKANAKVKSLNFAGLLGGGVLHTKLWLVDRTHLYIGSANMDWRSLSQVKELGLMALNCSCLANDFAKIFDVYWTVGNDSKIPSVWPDYLSTRINLKNPMNFTFMSNNYKTFVASSPPLFSPKGRTNDVDAILYCIEKAEKFIYISVMNYFPLTIYTAKIKYWPIIDDALRTAAIERKVHIRLLTSSWKHMSKSEVFFLKSLMELTDSYAGVKIEVRKFIVPTNPDFDRIPFSRVNHNKYMVTDVTAYIGTSNWSGDYFINTAGIGMVFESIGDQTSENLRQQLENIFHRDWYSEHSYALNESIPFVKRSTNTIEDYYLRSSRYILA